MREQFEGWAENKLNLQKRASNQDRYSAPATEAAWQAWQAALSNKHPSPGHITKCDIQSQNTEDK
jgi:hypothetical protein